MPGWEQLEFDDHEVMRNNNVLRRGLDALDEKDRERQEAARKASAQAKADQVLEAQKPIGRVARPNGIGKPNRYPGKCADCGQPVAENQGRAIKWNGKWAVFCGCKGYPIPDAKPVEHKGPKYEDNPWFQDMCNKGESVRSVVRTFMGYERDMVTKPEQCPGCKQETSWFRPLVGIRWCPNCNTGMRGDGTAIASTSPLHLAQP